MAAGEKNDAGTSEPLPDSGSLSEVELPRLLLRLYRDRFNGRLSLTRGKTRKAFEFQDGAPIASESNLPAERLSGVLEHAGTLTVEQRDEVDDYVEREKCQEGVALLKLEMLEPRALFLGLREQLRHRALESFGWADGEYEVTPGEERSEQVQPFRTDPYKLVQDGLRNHWSLDRVLGGLEERMDLYPRGGKELAEATRRLGLDAAVERLIAGINGKQKLGVLACGAGSSPASMSTFWVLDAVGALSYSDTPASDEDDEEGGPLEFDIEIRGANDAGEAPAAGAAPAKKPDALGAPQAENADAQKLRADIEEAMAALDERNHYEMLGVAPDASLAQIRKAYFQAAKRFHPDAIARLGLDDVRTEAGEVFSRIALANETLADSARRSDYDKSLAGGQQEIDVSTLR